MARRRDDAFQLSLNGKTGKSKSKSKSKSTAAAKHKTSDHDFAIAVVNEEIDETKKRLVDGSRKVKSAFDWAYVNASEVGADRNKTIA